MKKNALIQQVKATVQTIDPEARVILFGARARGDQHASSDWDFLILTARPADEKLKRRIRDRLIDTELEAEAVISTIIFSKKHWNDYEVTPLYQNIAREGVAL